MNRISAATGITAVVAAIATGIVVGTANGGTTNDAAKTRATSAAADSRIPEPITRFAESKNGIASFRSSVNTDVGQLTAAVVVPEGSASMSKADTASPELVCLSVALKIGGGGISCNKAKDGKLTSPLTTVTVLDDGLLAVTGLLPTGSTNAVITSRDGSSSLPVDAASESIGAVLRFGEIGTLTYRDAEGAKRTSDLASLASSVVR